MEMCEEGEGSPARTSCVMCIYIHTYIHTYIDYAMNHKNKQIYSNREGAYYSHQSNQVTLVTNCVV